MLHPSESVEPQPFLPRVRMIWFFVVVSVVAAALAIIRMAEQWQTLVAALLFIAVFLGLLAMFSGACFVVAFLLGAMERAVAGQQEQPVNPFSDGSLPEQIIPPTAVEEN